MVQSAPSPNQPVGPWTEHVRRFRDVHGMSYVAQAAASGVSRSTLYKVAEGRVAEVYGDTAAKLAALAPPELPLAPAGFAPAVGPRRRCQALSRVGHDQRAQKAAIGISHCRYRALVAGRTRWIAAGHADKISALYDEWACLDGPSQVTRRAAVKAGWFGPEAWPDDTIDDPTAEPLTVERADPLVVAKALARRIRWSEVRHVDRLAVVAALVAAGCDTPRAVATRVKTSPAVAEKLLAEVTR